MACWVTLHTTRFGRDGRAHVHYTAQNTDPLFTWSGEIPYIPTTRTKVPIDTILEGVASQAADYAVSLTQRDIDITNEGNLVATYTLADLGLHNDPQKQDDQTSTFQTGLDQVAISGGGTIAMEPWTVAVTKLRLKQGVSLVGSGMGPSNFGGTVLWRLAGATEDLLSNDPVSLPGTEWWHWGQFENFRIEDDPANAASTGCGFAVRCRTGEGFVMSRIFAYGFPEHNVAFFRGGTTLFLTRIHTMRAKTGAGLLIERQGADTWSGVCIDGVSGDNNKVALVRVNRAGAAYETFKINNVKAESKDVDCQPAVIELEGLNTAHVEVDNVSASAVGSTSNPQTIIRLAGVQDFCRLQVSNCKADTKYAYLVQNMVTPANNVLNDGTTLRMGYRQFVRWKMGSDTSYLVMKL